MTEPINPLVDALRTETEKAQRRMTTELATIDVPNTSAKITATMIDGKPFVALKPMCEAMGIDVDSQRNKLKTRSWATTVMSTVVAADGKEREMFMIDRRTMTMWLATIDENRIAEDARPIVQAFQAEAADALDAYFSTGVAVRPTAPVTPPAPINAPLDPEGQMRVLALAKGLISDDYLETPRYRSPPGSAAYRLGPGGAHRARPFGIALVQPWPGLLESPRWLVAQRPERCPCATIGVRPPNGMGGDHTTLGDFSAAEVAAPHVSMLNSCQKICHLATVASWMPTVRKPHQNVI